MAKIRVISVPTDKPKLDSAYANQQGWSLNTGSRVFDPTMSVKDPFKATSSIQPVPREIADFEAEKGEQLLRKKPDGTLANFTIGGERHSAGGSPLRGTPGDFILSDTKKMEIGGPVLALFGKSATTKQKYTPAELGKQYDLNKWQAIVDNPDTDKLQKDTAQKMIDGGLIKLSLIAEIQESKKGFPTGMPQITGSQNGKLQAKYGGYLPKAQFGKNNETYLNPSDNYTDTLWGVPQTGYRPMTGNEEVPTNLNEFVFHASNNNDSSLNMKMPKLHPTYEDTPENPYQVPAYEKAAPVNKEDNTSFNYPTPPANINTYNYKPPYAISNADKLAMLATAAVPPRTYLPTRSSYNFGRIEGYIPDETAAIAAQQAAINSAMQFNTQTSNGSRGRAINAGVLGAGLDSLQKIEGQYAEAKGRAVTDINVRQKELDKEAAIQNEQARQVYNREMAQAMQNKDQSTRNYLGANAQAYKQALANANKNQMLNSINNRSPFYLDPRTNQLAYNPNYQGSLAGNAQSQGSFEQTAADMKKRLIASGFTPEKAEIAALQHARSFHESKTYNPYNPMSVKYRQTGSSFGMENEQGFYDPTTGFSAGFPQ